MDVKLHFTSNKFKGLHNSFKGTEIIEYLKNYLGFKGF